MLAMDEDDITDTGVLLDGCGCEDVFEFGLEVLDSLEEVAGSVPDSDLLSGVLPHAVKNDMTDMVAETRVIAINVLRCMK